METKELIKLVESKTGFSSESSAVYALSLVWNLATPKDQKRILEIIGEYN